MTGMEGRRKAENGRNNSLEVIEKKIEKAKLRVVKTKEAYDSAVKDLKDLMDKRDMLRKDELFKLLLKSNRTYEEIELFLKAKPSNQD